MAQARAWFVQQNDAGRKILLAALVILAVMILFPPKEVTSKNPLLGASESRSVGYHFILDDPAGEQKATAEKMFGKDADGLFGSGVEWSKLLVQLVIVAGAAFGLVMVTKRNSG